MTDFTCAINWNLFWLYNLSLVVDSTEGKKKEYVALNLVTKDQLGSEVNALSGNHGSRSSTYHHAEFQEEDERKVKHVLFFCTFRLKLNCSV